MIAKTNYTYGWMVFFYVNDEGSDVVGMMPRGPFKSEQEAWRWAEANAADFQNDAYFVVRALLSLDPLEPDDDDDDDE